MQSIWKHLRRAIGSTERLPIPEDQSSTENCVYWGGRWIPVSEAANHFLAVGASGSGKTLMLRLLAQSIFPKIGQGYDARGLYGDVKGDGMPVLTAICPHARIMTMDPFDERGVAWAISDDVREPRVALEIVYMLIPREQESQPFFSNAARGILFGIIKSFMLSGIEWTLGDLLRVTASLRRIKAVLKKHPQTRDAISRYWGDKRVLDNIHSQLGSKLVDFESIAAAWDGAKEKVSLSRWIEDELILVLRISDISRSASEAIAEAVFNRAVDLNLAQTESFTRETYYIFDETSEWPHLRRLRPLLKRGRSKGGRAVLATQSVAGMRDPKLYGPHVTADILGQIGHKFFGRLECPETAEWASQLFGDQEIDQYTASTTTSSRDSSTTRNHQIVTRRSVLPSELMDLSPCTRENGLTYFSLSRHAGCYHGHIPGDELFDGSLIPPDPGVPEFVERPIESQYLRAWTNADAARFGVPVSRKKSQEDPRGGQPPKRGPLDDLDDLAK